MQDLLATTNTGYDAKRTQIIATPSSMVEVRDPKVFLNNF